MELEITVKSDLEKFVLLERITQTADVYIKGSHLFTGEPIYTVVESMAQLGAYHVRLLTDFTRHVFLLKIVDCSFFVTGKPSGRYNFTGRLVNRSKSAFFYLIKAETERKAVAEGRFLFAAVDYNAHFKKELLNSHYRKVFSCLSSDTKTD